MLCRTGRHSIPDEREHAAENPQQEVHTVLPRKVRLLIMTEESDSSAAKTTKREEIRGIMGQNLF